MANSVSYSVFLKDHMSKDLFDIGRTGQNTFDKLDDSQDRFQRELKESKREAGGLNSVMGSLRNTAAGLFAGLAIFEGLKKVVNLGGEMEQTRVAFSTMMGSVDAANKSIEELVNFSNLTPLNPDQVLKGGKALLAFGVASDQLIPKMSRIGDIASGTGKDFNELVTIYGKAKIAGTLYAEDINQLIEAGIPIMGEFAKQLGVSESQVKKMASEGKLSFGNLEQAFAALTGEGGIFFGLMDKQSKTFLGRLSSLMGTITSTLTVFAEGFLNPTLGVGIDFLIKLIENLTHVISENKNIFFALVGGITAGYVAFKTLSIIGTITKLIKGMTFANKMLTIGQWKLNFAMNMNPLGIVIAGIAALTAGVIYAWNEFEGFRQFLFSLWETVKQVFSNIVTYFKGIFSPVIEALATFQDDSLSIFEKTKKIGGNMLDLAFNLSPVGMAKNMYDFAKDGGMAEGIADAWAEGQRKGTESWEKDHKKEEEKKGEKTASSPTVPVPSQPAGGSSSALAAATGTSSASSGGGGSSRNLSIHIDSLVKELTISTTNMKEGAAEIEQKINEVLIKAIRDFEISY